MEDIDGISELFTFGFTLGDKTISTEHKLARPEIPYEISNTSSTWRDVYSALEQSVIKACQENKSLGLSLSGGMDSRIIAGIIAANDFDIPCYTINNVKNEVKRAKQVADVLGLRHFIVPVKEVDVDHLRDKAIQYMGSSSISYFASDHDVIEKLGVDCFIGGYFGTELWNDSLVETPKDYAIRFYMERQRCKSLKERYHKKALDNLINACEGLDIRALRYEIYIRARARIQEKFMMRPILDSDVISASLSLPRELRHDKIINHLIQKNMFPELVSVPDVLAKGRFYKFDRRIRKSLGMKRRNAFDPEHLFRSMSHLKEYAKLGIPVVF